LIELTQGGANKEEHQQKSSIRQLRLLDEPLVYTSLDAKLWHGSFNAKESSLQQLSPYVGKLKSGMVQVLIGIYSRPGDWILDPFSGSGVVALESVLANRVALANDLSPYAYTLTRGKLEAPHDLETALQQAEELVAIVEREAHFVDVSGIPSWVQEFFHPDTLKEVVVAFRVLKDWQNYFLTSCLLGILHHVRPGFLSYPASHLVPYLRKSKFPPEEYPDMYTYRDLRSRLVNKVKRAYRRPYFPRNWEGRQYQVWSVNSTQLPIEDENVDSIISSPPYFGALDYARDNRLRLWFLGCEDWKELDKSLTANHKVYLPQMSDCLKEMHRVLKPNGYCVLVLGDVERDGKTHRTAEILSDLAANTTDGGLKTELIYDDRIPDERRTRRLTKTTKFERILVMRKS
jgi:hypothetical protein